MITADDARKMAYAYKPPEVTIDTVIPSVMDVIYKAAIEGKFMVRIRNLPLVYKVKETLKNIGYDVILFREINEWTKQKEATGEIQVSWEPK